MFTFYSKAQEIFVVDPNQLEYSNRARSLYTEKYTPFHHNAGIQLRRIRIPYNISEVSVKSFSVFQPLKHHH